MTDIDPWAETWSEFASWRLLLSEALTQRDVPKVASLIGATDAIGELAWLGDPTNVASVREETRRLVAVEDAIVASLSPALDREDGQLCEHWRVACNPRSHGVLVVMFMSYFMRMVVQQWRPSFVQMYEGLVQTSREQLRASR